MANREIISLAIPAFNSSMYIEMAFAEVYNDPRISEIIVVDDASGDYAVLEKKMKKFPKVQLFRNKTNLGGFWNKRYAVSLCSNRWVVVLDSDNRLKPGYINAFYETIIPDQNVIYCPSKGRDTLDYNKYAGEYLDIESIKGYLNKDRDTITKFLNTGNYIVNKETYLQTAAGMPNINNKVPCAIAFNYLWLKQGRSFFICPGMEYTHTVGFGRFWKDNVSYMKPIVDDIIYSIQTGKTYVLP